MTQQPLINSKTLLEQARALKTPTAGNLTEADREKVKGWQAAVLKRMVEIWLLVPEIGPAWHDGLTGEDAQRMWPNRLAADDPKRTELITEYQELQKKYRRCSDILSGSAKLEEVG